MQGDEELKSLFAFQIGHLMIFVILHKTKFEMMRYTIEVYG
jgi:hypothetical protein